MPAVVINHELATLPDNGKVMFTYTENHPDYEAILQKKLLENGVKETYRAMNKIDDLPPGAFEQFDYIIDTKMACFRQNNSDGVCVFCGGVTKPMTGFGMYAYYNYCDECHSLCLEDKQFVHIEYDDDYVNRLGGEYLHHGYGIQAGDILSAVGNPKPGKFLEIGFSSPIILMGLGRRGWEVTGMDMAVTNSSKKAIKAVGGKVIEGDVENAKITEKYDLIWISHVVEHLNKPLETLKKLYDSLNDGGMLCVCAPDPEELWGDEIYKGVAHCHPEQHLYIGSGKAYIDFLESLGAKKLFFQRDNDNALTYVHCYEWRLVVQKGEK